MRSPVANLVSHTDDLARVLPRLVTFRQFMHFFDGYWETLDEHLLGLYQTEVLSFEEVDAIRGGVSRLGNQLGAYVTTFKTAGIPLGTPTDDMGIICSR